MSLENPQFEQPAEKEPGKQRKEAATEGGEPRPEESGRELRTAFETKEGEKFFAEMLTNPEDPRIEKVQEIFENEFGKEELDPVEVIKQAMTGRMETGEKVPPYLVNVVEDSKGEVKGVSTGAVVETVDSKGRVSEKSGVSLGCYFLTSPDVRGKLKIPIELFKAQELSAKNDAERRGIEIKGYMAEAHNAVEALLNRRDIKRAYIKTKDGFEELPYEQPPVDWNPKTGKPAEDAGTVPEHLMLKLASGKDKLSGKELMEMIGGMYRYNNYREKEYFKNEKAHQKHTEFIKEIGQKLIDFIGKNKVHLFSRQEREVMTGQGVQFINHKEKEDRDEARKEALAEARTEKKEQKEKWKEHFGGLAEAQLEQEKMARAAKKEKAALEAAKIPEKGMERERILKEVGIEKPAESFGEFQKKLDENLGKARTYRGGMISETDKLMMARNAYLVELGYSVKYKGLLLDKAEILNEKGGVITDTNGKPMEFKSFYFSKTERQINEFLKDKVKEKFEGKPEKAMTEEEKMEAGFKKTIKITEQEQKTREGKISFLTKMKNLGKSSLEALMRGMSHLAGSEELGMFGLRSGKNLAVEAGKDLAVLGLTPIAATEEAGRYIAGRIQTREALKKTMIIQERIKALENVPADKRHEYYNDLMESLKVGSKIANAELIKGYDKIYIKGKILTKLIEALGGELSRPVEKTLAPPPPKPERI